MHDLETLIAPRLTRLSLDLPVLVRVWSVSLADPPAPAGAESVPGAGERARADAFRVETLRLRHVWCRLALRHLLGAGLGCAPDPVGTATLLEGPSIHGSAMASFTPQAGLLAASAPLSDRVFQAC
jgi:hypothetical protein